MCLWAGSGAPVHPPLLSAPAILCAQPATHQGPRRVRRQPSLWVTLVSLAVGIWALNAEAGKVHMWALQRCAQTQDPDSPYDILGKSLLPAASVFPFVKWVCWTQLIGFSVWSVAK